MGKVLSYILSPLTLVDRDLGNAVRTAVLSAIGYSIAGPIGAAAGASLSQAISGLNPAKQPPPETTAVELKLAIPPRVSAYGRLRLYGAYILYETASDGTAVDVWAFHDGRIDAVEQFYIGDDKVTVNGAGWVAPGDAGRYGKASDRVRVKANLGPAIGTAWAEVISKLPGIWTSQHRGDGVVTGFMLSTPVKAKDFSGVYSSGGPNQTPLSIVMRAQCVFDWRDGTQSIGDPRTWKWSENACLHLGHYLLTRQFAIGPMRPPSDALYWSDIAAMYQAIWAAKFASTITYWTAAANDCDVAMPLKGGGTEPRYRSCVAHKHTDEHKSVVASLLGAFDGWMSPRADGALVVYSGRFYEPTVTIGSAQIVSYSIQDGVDQESAVNEIPLTYVSAEHDFATVDTDAWRDEDDITARGKVLSSPQADQVPSHAQARRLGKRSYARAMARTHGTVTTNDAGRAAIGQRYINLPIIEAGYTFFTGPVEITKVSRNITTGGQTMEWVAADPNVDAWNPATEEGEPAPVGDRVAPEPLETPVVTNAVSDFTAATDGGTGVRVAITADGLERDDVTWFARWRVVGSPSWVENTYSDLDPGPSVSLLTGFVPTGADVEVAVSYGTGDGRLSDWSDAFEVDTSTDLVAPDAATTITPVSWTDALSLTTPSIARASSYRWRFYDGATLIREIVTPTRSVSYTASQAALDGVKRAYVVKLAGMNAAGAGAEYTSTSLANAAPAALTSPAIAGGASTATGTADVSPATDLGGYALFYSSTTGFDPSASGGVVTSGVPSINVFGLAAGTYYGRLAAYDKWTANPALLNLSSEISFSITTGGGSTPSGGGIGGGGYHGGGGGGGGQIP